MPLQLIAQRAEVLNSALTWMHLRRFLLMKNANKVAPVFHAFWNIAYGFDKSFIRINPATARLIDSLTWQ
jgi:hypothetical protein